jgi:RHS repeat-associated protein
MIVSHCVSTFFTGTHSRILRYYYDNETGLYYLNARYYSPEWRRFISPDDMSYLDPDSVNGLNLYCYCNNDPVNYADPSGHSAILTATLILMGVGILAGLGYAAYTDATDDNAINGSIGWQGYVGYSLLGGAIGAGIGLGIGYTFPYLASFFGSSFTLTLLAPGLVNMGGVLVAVGGVAIPVTGAQIAGGAIISVAGIGILLFASDHRPGNNKAQNSQLRAAVRATGNNPNDPHIKDKINKIETYIRRHKLDLGWKELLELVRSFLE